MGKRYLELKLNSAGQDVVLPVLVSVLVHSVVHWLLVVITLNLTGQCLGVALPFWIIVLIWAPVRVCSSWEYTELVGPIQVQRFPSACSVIYASGLRTKFSQRNRLVCKVLA